MTLVLSLVSSFFLCFGCFGVLDLETLLGTGESDLDLEDFSSCFLDLLRPAGLDGLCRPLLEVLATGDSRLVAQVV